MASKKSNGQTTRAEDGTGRVYVLLVEDSPTDAQLLRESLRDYPLQQFEIEHVEKLAEALQLLAQRSFDVILLDLNLPDSHGMQTGERQIRMAAQVPIIVLTGTDDERLAVEAMRLGIEDYLVKEYSRGNAIGRAVRYAVERRRSQQVQQEVNERLQAQAEELRRSEARLNRSQEIAQLGSWELDLTTYELTWSDEVYRIFGLEPREFGATYEAFLEHVHPEDRQAVDDAYRGSVRAGRNAYEIEHRVIRRDTGAVRIVHEKCEHFRDAAGRIVRSVGMVHDITERRRAEEALRESEQWFRTLTNALPQLVWTADPDGRVDYYNDRYKEFRGIERAADGSFRWAMVLHEDDVRPTVAAWEHALRTGETYQIEHRVQRADGSYHWYLSRGMPVHDGAGRIVKWFGTATDIDKVKQAEAALRELTTTLDGRVAQRTAELKHRAGQLQKLTLEMSEAEERERKRLAEILHDGLQQQLAAAKFHLGLLGTRLRGDASLQEAAAEVTGMLKDAIEKTRSLSHELSPALLYQGDFGEALEWLANQMQAKHGLVVHVQTRGPAAIASDPIRAFLFRTAQEILFNIVKHARVTEATVRLQRRRRRLWLTISDRGREDAQCGRRALYAQDRSRRGTARRYSGPMRRQ